MENKRYSVTVLTGKPEYFDCELEHCECGNLAKRIVFKMRFHGVSHVFYDFQFYCNDCIKTVYKYIK